MIVFNSKDIQNTEALSQYAYNVDLGSMYYRMKWAGTWQSWIRIDNFGCNTPSDLASLLGVPKLVEGVISNDLGDSITALKYFVDNTLSDSWSIRLIHVNANVHGVAIGMKLSSSYSSFIVFSYNGDINLVYKSSDVWYEKAL